MLKLLANYIREQKTSWIQVFGLGFVIIIMVSSFLSLNFATTYVSDQYWKDIAHEEFHQELPIYLNAGFRNGPIADSWLDNINYVNEENVINQAKIVRATFQIQKIKDAKNNSSFYRFFFEKPEDDIHVGEQFALATNHNYVDFTVSIPFNYPSVEAHDQFVVQQEQLIEKYVYDEQNPQNKTNFFITNIAALDFYHKNIQKPDYPKYEENDISNQAKIYQLLVMGMLYGDNISWARSFHLNDLLITGKVINFVQTTVEDKVNAPILIDSNNAKINPLDLKDDQILIYKEFAQENNLVIGQDYIFAGYRFHIVGFATSALAANNSYYFFAVGDNKNQTVAWVNQATMNKISSNPYTINYENYFVPFNPEIGSKKQDNQWIYQYFHQKLIDDRTLDKTTLYFAINNSIHVPLLFNPIENWRDNNYKIQAMEVVVWKDINMMKDLFLEIASIFLALIFIVVSIIIFIILFKMIDRNKRLIGILKAHGYPSWKLNLSLVIALILPIIFFSIVGAALAVVFSHIIISTYSTAIILINYGWPFYYQISLLIIILPFIALSLVSFAMVAFLLRVNALILINNSWSKNKYSFSISALFSLIASSVTKNFSYYNKLALTTMFRGFGKTIFVMLISVFASTLLLFSFSSAGLINNLFGLQFASVNYKFNNKYNFESETINNFINSDRQLLYKKENVEDIENRPSLYQPIKQAISEMLASPEPLPSKMIDFRYGYVMGSELYDIRHNIIEPWLETQPDNSEFKKTWNKNIYFIDYLTNDNGKKESNLLVSFGLLPYNDQLETPYSELEFYDAHNFDINTINTNQYYYDNEHDFIRGDWSQLAGSYRIVNGVSANAEKFLNPGFRNANFSGFTNLTLESMRGSRNWLNDNFLRTRDLIIRRFNIQNPDTAAVKIIPMIGSTIPGVKPGSGGDGNNIGKTVLYRYRGLDSQDKYIIGVIYDGAVNLLQNTILMPETWLNQAIFGNYGNLASQFANSKFTNFKAGELHQYLPIISTNNDYMINLARITDSNYLNAKGVAPGLTTLYDADAIKEMFQAKQYSLQVLLILFAVFSIVLSFMIIIIISNINIRDNLVLINILKSLGYSAPEISYVFLLTTVPILIIFSLFAVFIAPTLTGFIALAIAQFLSFNVPIIFEWWYFALTLLIIILIYLFSYIITWKINVKNKQLMALTK